MDILFHGLKSVTNNIYFVLRIVPDLDIGSSFKLASHHLFKLVSGSTRFSKFISFLLCPNLFSKEHWFTLLEEGYLEVKMCQVCLLL